MELRKELILCFKSIGVDIPDDKDDVDLREYFEDSMMFISAIVEIENYFEIDIPDDLLMYDKFASLNSFALELQEAINSVKI